MGGLFSSKKFNPSTDLQDLTGKVAIVTGGNSGIGYTTVKFLARRGAKVYLAARNESRAVGALAGLEAEGFGSGLVVWLKLDLVDPRGVKKAAEEFMEKESRLDIIVNNATVPLLFTKNATFEKTADGMVETMSTNHVGHFVLVRTLLPLLKKTTQMEEADVRIVNLSSDSHSRIPKVRFRNLDDFNRDFNETFWPAHSRYGHSKLANLLFTKELQKRLDADGVPIIVTAVHPGVVNTFADRMPFPKISRWLLTYFAFSPDEGSWTSLIAAASPAVRAEPTKYKGKYLVPVGQVSRASKQAEDPELAKELWDSTEAYLRELRV